jgi:hypothetical protein
MIFNLSPVQISAVDRCGRHGFSFSVAIIYRRPTLLFTWLYTYIASLIIVPACFNCGIRGSNRLNLDMMHLCALFHLKTGRDICG